MYFLYMMHSNNNNNNNNNNNIRSSNKMAALGYVYTLGNKPRVPANAVQLGIPPALVS